MFILPFTVCFTWIAGFHWPSLSIKSWSRIPSDLVQLCRRGTNKLFPNSFRILGLLVWLFNCIGFHRKWPKNNVHQSHTSFKHYFKISILSFSMLDQETRLKVSITPAWTESRKDLPLEKLDFSATWTIKPSVVAADRWCAKDTTSSAIAYVFGDELSFLVFLRSLTLELSHWSKL